MSEEQVRADERAKIVWWLRAGIAGPGSLSCSKDVLDHLRELADVIENEPERFECAPGFEP